MNIIREKTVEQANMTCRRINIIKNYIFDNLQGVSTLITVAAAILVPNILFEMEYQIDTIANTEAMLIEADNDKDNDKTSSVANSE